MSKSSSAVSDAAVDLEKGTTALKDAENETVAIVDPLKANLVHRFMDTVVGAYVQIFIGAVAYGTKHALNWWDLLLSVLVLISLISIALWLISKLREAAIVVLATKRSVASGSNLSTNLLASNA